MSFSTKAPIHGEDAPRPSYNFGQLKVRKMKVKQAQADVITDRNNTGVNFSKMSNSRLVDIIEGTDVSQKRKLSIWFANKKGMYNRAVRYIADIYKFDYMIYPNIAMDDELKEEKQKKIAKRWDEVLDYFDNSGLQIMARRWATKVCIEGCYYGYICEDVNDRLVIQDLPTEYCRSRFMWQGLPLVEFNVSYFDKVSSNDDFRTKILRLFPEEIQKGYREFKNGKLGAEDQGDQPGWILLDINRAFKFNFFEDDTPVFISAIPSLLELDEVQDLEKEKLLQEIQKILIQTFDLDKNGQIPFTMPELQQLNQNALDMVGDAVGVSVLSTIADVHLEDLKTTTSRESEGSVAAAKDDVYNNLGISTNLFNTDGNLALDKSITIDEAFAKPLLLQFERFFNRYLEWKFNKKDTKFRMKMLNTSIFNYKELSDAYKDLTKLGFSRFLPMITLGHTQKEVISLAKLEQQILQLDAYMLPPFSSNTMSSDTWQNIKGIQREIISGNQSGAAQDPVQQAAAKAAASVGSSSSPSSPTAKGGRPELPDDKKSDKTIANNASK